MGIANDMISKRTNDLKGITGIQWSGTLPWHMGIFCSKERDQRDTKGYVFVEVWKLHQKLQWFCVSVTERAEVRVCRAQEDDWMWGVDGLSYFGSQNWDRGEKEQY